MQTSIAQPQDEDQSKRVVEDVEAGESGDTIGTSRSSWWLRSWRDGMSERAKGKLEQKNREKHEKEMIKAIEAILKKPDSVKVGDFPSGYPLQAALQSSIPDFSIYRNFSYLHSRVILELQDQLRELEGQLQVLDKLHSEAEDPEQRERVTSRVKDMEAAQMSRPIPGVPDNTSDIPVHRAERPPESNLIKELSEKPILSERAKLLDDIQQKLVRYDEVLVHARRLAEFQRPTDDEWLNLRRWYYNRPNLSSEDEDKYIRMKYDLITLRPRIESGRIDAWIKRLVILREIVAEYFLKPSGQGFQDPDILYFRDRPIERLAVLLVSIVIILLLAVPVFVMFCVTWIGTRPSTFLNIGLLIVFGFLFSVAMGILTTAKRAELFAATAAYCAVLVVFIGNFSSNVGSNRS